MGVNVQATAAVPLPFPPKMAELVSSTPALGGLTQQQIDALQENFARFVSQNLTSLAANPVPAIAPATATAVPVPSPEPVLVASSAVPVPTLTLPSIVPVSLPFCNMQKQIPVRQMQ